MIGLADQNGKTYKSKYGLYSKRRGFELSELSKSMSKTELVDRLFHEDCWLLKKEPKKMTKEEIEKALGYEIEIEKDDSNDNSNNDLEKFYYRNKILGDDILSFMFR